MADGTTGTGSNHVDAAPPQVRLVLFGDSWVRANTEVTWPELLGEHLGWPTLNVALPGSHSGTLALQYELMQRVLAAQGRTLHPECWALVHAGGNDILHSSPDQILMLVGKLLCCGLCMPCGCVNNMASLDGALFNVEQLSTRLRDQHGVRNVMLCGLPLSVHMPLVSRYLQLLLGVGKMVTCLGGIAVQRLNWLWLRKLDAMGSSLGLRVVTFDEAAAIEQIVTELQAEALPRRGESRSGGGGVSGGAGGMEEEGSGMSEEGEELSNEGGYVSEVGSSVAEGASGHDGFGGEGVTRGSRGKIGSGGAEADEAERGALLRGRREAGAREDRRRVMARRSGGAHPDGNDAEDAEQTEGNEDEDDPLWADMLHPNQRFHTALSLKMLERFNAAARAAEGRRAQGSGPWCFSAAGIMT